MFKKLLWKYGFVLLEAIVGTIILIYCFIQDTFGARLGCAIVCYASALFALITIVIADRVKNSKLINILMAVNVIVSGAAFLTICITYQNFDFELMVIGGFIVVAGIAMIFPATRAKSKKETTEFDEEQA